MTKSIGIIIPTRNRPILLERALQSVFEQTWTNWTLTIVNDGGNAGEIETLVNYFKNKYNSENKIAVYTNNFNLGKAASCNVALEKIKDELAVVLNDDDCWAPEFLQVSITQLEYRNKLNPLVKGIMCLANIYHEEVLDDGAYTQWCDTPRMEELNQYDDYVSSSALVENNLFSSSQFIFHKEVVNRIGAFNKSMLVYSDWEFNIRFIAHYEIYRQPQPFVNVYKRFWTTNPSYFNLLTVHIEKLDYFSNRINDELLRQTIHHDPANKNGVDVIALQTLLLMRRSGGRTLFSQGTQQIQHIQVNQSAQNNQSPQYQQILQLVNDQMTVRLANLENKFDAQAKLNQDWFKYFEYNLKNPVYRKSKKAAAKLKDYFDKVFDKHK
jgi:glycosyltransferase involved in cell wall biosynthesis